MKIGDRVAYAEENVALDDLHGTVVEPAAEERNAPTELLANDVFVEWDDGERYWEDPASLVVIS